MATFLRPPCLESAAIISARPKERRSARRGTVRGLRESCWLTASNSFSRLDMSFQKPCGLRFLVFSGGVIGWFSFCGKGSGVRLGARLEVRLGVGTKRAGSVCGRRVGKVVKSLRGRCVVREGGLAGGAAMEHIGRKAMTERSPHLEGERKRGEALGFSVDGRRAGNRLPPVRDPGKNEKYICCIQAVVVPRISPPLAFMCLTL